MSHQTSQRQGYDGLLLQENLHAALRGIQVQNDAMTHQLGGDVVAFEIDADHAVTIHFPLQVQPIKLMEPAIRIHHASTTTVLSWANRCRTACEA